MDRLADRPHAMRRRRPCRRSCRRPCRRGASRLRAAALVAVLAAVAALVVAGSAGAGDATLRAGFHRSGITGVVNESVVYDDGGGAALYVAGEIYAIGDESVEGPAGEPAGIVRWDGETWSVLPLPPVLEASGVGGRGVTNLAVVDEPGGAVLYATARFPEGQLLRWDGAAATFHATPPGVYMSTTPGDLAPWSEGTVAGVALSGRRAAADDSEGVWWFRQGEWQQLATGGGELANVEFASERLLVLMGNFDTLTFGGQTVSGYHGIAAWDGATWRAFGDGFVQAQPDVWDVAVWDDGEGEALFAAGGFRINQGAPASRVGRWNGTSWEPMGTTPVGTVVELAVHDDGSGPALYAAGDFEILNDGRPAPFMARWDDGAWSALDTGAGVAAATAGTARLVCTLGMWQAAPVHCWDGGPRQTPPTAAYGSLTLGAIEIVDRFGRPRLVAGGTRFIDVFDQPAPDADVPLGILLEWTGAEWEPLGTPNLGLTISDLLAARDGALWVSGHFVRRLGSVPASHVTVVERCGTSCGSFFADGFESGDTSAWQ